MITATAPALPPDDTTSTCYIQILDDDTTETSWTITYTDNCADSSSPFDKDVEEFRRWVLAARRFDDMIHEISRRAMHEEGLAHARKRQVYWASTAARRARQRPSMRRRRRMQLGPRK